MLQIVSVIPFLFFLENTSIFIMVFFSLIILSSQNAWNMIDVMDGLTAGISFIIFCGSGILLLQFNELIFYASLSFAIAFGVMGFRLLNRNPAQIFMGETGSLLLGSLYGFILIKTFMLSQTTALFIVLLAVAPFFELLFLIVVRTKKKIPFYRGSSDHFALRMLNNGFLVKEINRLVLIFCSINSSIIITMFYLFDSSFSVIFCSLLGIASTLAAYFYFVSLPAKTLSR